MVEIAPITKLLADRAQRLGRQVKNISLKDGSLANISWSKDACDCFVVKDNKIIGGRGASGSVEHVKNQLAIICDKLQGFLKPGQKINL